MTNMGMMKTTKPIERAMREIRDWLVKLHINGMEIDTKYDAKQNIALVRFFYQRKNYEFKSTKQANCRLNMWGIAKVMEGKVRAHIMGIEEFQKSMVAYLQIEASKEYANYTTPQENRENNTESYALLGISPLASNDELVANYKKVAKGWHPDMAGSEEAKKVFEKRFSEINEAWQKIKKERGLQ